jgi:hypothetical protein
VPDAAPHLPVPALPDALAQRNLLGERPLDEEGQAGAGARGHRVVKDFAEGGVASCLGAQADQLVLKTTKKIIFLLMLLRIFMKKGGRGNKLVVLPSLLVDCKILIFLNTYQYRTEKLESNG